MPERTVTGITQGTLKFAAGNDVTREQVSSTWYVRITRGMEIYILNFEAGGNRAHISFHKDGRCHYKVDDPAAKGGKRKVTEWELPEPMEPTGALRLATVVIPNLGLVLPDNFAGVDPETALIPPPAPGQQLDVDIILEPGPVPKGAWPGQTSELQTMYVGRFSLYENDPVENPEDEGFLHCTVVATFRDEGEEPRRLASTTVNVVDGATPPGDLRVVLFETVEVDGQQLPVLTEMPVGHRVD
jgi:hypothetical protein